MRPEIEADKPARVTSAALSKRDADPMEEQMVPEGLTRTARLALLRSRIAEGSYRVDTEAIASKLMNRLGSPAAPVKQE